MHNTWQLSSLIRINFHWSSSFCFNFGHPSRGMVSLWRFQLGLVNQISVKVTGACFGITLSWRNLNYISINLRYFQCYSFLISHGYRTRDGTFGLFVVLRCSTFPVLCMSMTSYFHYHVHVIHEIFYVSLGIGFGIFSISHFGYMSTLMTIQLQILWRARLILEGAMRSISCLFFSSGSTCTCGYFYIIGSLLWCVSFMEISWLCHFKNGQYVV